MNDGIENRLKQIWFWRVGRNRCGEGEFRWWKDDNGRNADFGAIFLYLIRRVENVRIGCVVGRVDEVVRE